MVLWSAWSVGVLILDCCVLLQEVVLAELELETNSRSATLRYKVLHEAATKSSEAERRGVLFLRHLAEAMGSVLGRQ